MGLAMARNLQRHLAGQKAVNMLYSNRTMSRGETLAALGGIPEPSFERVVAECGIIFTMVSPPSNIIRMRIPLIMAGIGLQRRSSQPPNLLRCQTGSEG